MGWAGIDPITKAAKTLLIQCECLNLMIELIKMGR